MSLCPHCGFGVHVGTCEEAEAARDGVAPIDWRARCLAAEAERDAMAKEFQTWRLGCLNDHATNAEVDEEYDRAEALTAERDQLKLDLAEACEIAKRWVSECCSHPDPSRCCYDDHARIAELRKRAGL